MPKESIPEEDFKKGVRRVESEEAQKSLQKALEEAANLPEEEIEKKIFSIEGVKKGKDWEKMKKHLKRKKTSN